MDYRQRSLTEEFQGLATVDLDYTAQISMQMNVPDRIYPVAKKQAPESILFDRGDMNLSEQMIIPDRIMLHGQNSGAENDIHDRPMKNMVDDLHLNVQTPPKIISLLESNFPVLSEFTEKTLNAVNKKLTDQQNLQKQIDVLSRQIKLLEIQNQSRLHRELIFYPLLIGFAVFHVARYILYKN
ncbi:hypothetical protein HELRODRAFT_167670 [Helobdella robusta]|uniref:Mitochondrial fission factor n=1 Tax=Helobdella robusta TaxID=6412 RepID=T1EZN2_HELRO|nr:hypothetical protein HELRODRAFT_167670 [Helobdella robusta]ESO09851.1 hypothetical protein HELRODRAFT_167670 [Helobdella robusta]